jgi:hypothetical protein
MTNNPYSSTEIDRYPVANLAERYQISRQTLYESRLKPLNIKPFREGNGSFVNADDVQKLDTLDAHIKGGGTVKDFISSQKNGVTLEPGTISRLRSALPEGQLAPVEQSSPPVTPQSDLQSNLLNALLYAIAEANSRNQNTYTIIQDELELTQQRYKKLLWYAENQIQLTSDELRSLIGIKPSGSQFTRGSFTFTRCGKIGNQSAWSISKN